MTKFQAFICI